MLIYYAFNITSLKVTDRAKPRVRNSPITIFILKFDFQVPYNNNIIFTQNVLYFSVNVIFDEFSIKRFILFI
jgi:hypothetical protein